MLSSERRLFLIAIPRESYCGRLPVQGDFGDSTEIASVVSWDINRGGVVSIVSLLGVTPR